jgi:peptidoglycan biosynthesis protein MviN/MurJ (putative lipid II flippase)
MIINCFVVAINIGANLLFFRWLGVKGLALGFTTAYIFSMLIDGTVLRFRLGRLGGRRVLSTVIKTLVAAAAMTLVIYASDYLIVQLHPTSGFWRDLLEMLLPMVQGIAVFFFVAHALHMEELSTLKVMLSRQLGRFLHRRVRA